MNNQLFLVVPLFFLLLVSTSSIFSQPPFTAELSTLPVIGMFPQAGNVRYSNAEIRGEFLGATLNYMLLPTKSYADQDQVTRLDLSVSAHLLGINWSQLFSKEQTTLLDWGYLRAGLSIPFYLSDKDNFFGRSSVRFQTGLGRVIINVPELTETGYQWGFDISFSFTYKLND